jgi:hypothetical protein
VRIVAIPSAANLGGLAVDEGQPATKEARMGPLESKLSLKFRGRRISGGPIRNIQRGEVGAEAKIGKILKDIAAAVEDLQNAVMEVAREVDKLGFPVVSGEDDS